MKKVRYIFLLSMSIGLGCRTGKKNVPSLAMKPNEESFPAFYNKFNTDSLFQINRTVFPLKGYTNQSDLKEVDYLRKESMMNDSLKINILWKKKNWIMHHKVIDTTYKVERVSSDSAVFEKVYLPDSEFEAISLFKKINGLWYLTYYYDIE